MLAALDTRAASGTAAHLVCILHKCPICDAHVVQVNLVNYNVDKQVANRSIGKLDKIEPVATDPDVN
jgi:hypothetical protein